MSGTRQEVTPVLEDSKYKNVKHVSVEKTVQALLDVIAKDGAVELVATDNEINRVGMVIRQVVEKLSAEIGSMKTKYR
jgi:hypothetical protein